MGRRAKYAVYATAAASTGYPFEWARRLRTLLRRWAARALGRPWLWTQRATGTGWRMTLALRTVAVCRIIRR